MIRSLPARPRDRLAALILAALHDSGARRLLVSLAAAREAEASEWLVGDEGEWMPLLRERARRASTALAGLPLGSRHPALKEALAAATVLFDAGLYFEVHELLEPYWVATTGSEREALQGLIQVAVGLQHLANHNARGARALLEQGSERLRGAELPGLDVAGFADAIRERLEGGLESFGAGAPPFPRES